MGISLSQWLTSELLGFQPFFSGSELAEYVLVSACTRMFMEVSKWIITPIIIYKDVVYVPYIGEINQLTNVLTSMDTLVGIIP